MKKVLALLRALCMVTAALPALAETAPAQTETQNKLDKLMELIGELKERAQAYGYKISVILSLLKLQVKRWFNAEKEKAAAYFSGLKDRLSEKGGGFLSSLKDKLTGGKNKDGEKGGFLSSLKDKLTGDSETDLNGVLETLFSEGSDGKDDGLDLEATIARINEEAEKEFGENVPGKKEDVILVDFFGDWTYSKLVFDGETYDLGGDEEGLRIGEGTYILTSGGEKSPDYTRSEAVEMKLEKGALKILLDDMWTVLILTENGVLVNLMSGGMQVWYVRAGK